MITTFGESKFKEKLEYAKRQLKAVGIFVSDDEFNFHRYDKLNKGNVDEYVNKTYNFPKKAMLTISGFIYQELNEINEAKNNDFEPIIYKIIKNLKDNALWIKEIPQYKLNLILSKFNDTNYLSFLFYYFLDLIKIIFKLIQKNNDHIEELIHLSIYQFIDELIDDNITMGFAKNTLNKYITEIFDYLKLKFNDFTLERLKYQEKLFNEGELKECGVCHKIKPYSDFYMRINGRPHYYCKDCRNRLISLRDSKNKLTAIYVINNNAEIGCRKCGLSVDYLPAIAAHHPISNKTITLAKIRHKDLEYIVNKLKQEKVQFLCFNCHSLELNYSYVFFYFRDFLTEKDLFLKSSPIILHKKMDTLIAQSDFVTDEMYAPATIKRDLKRLLKKRYIIEALFGGYCVGCRNVGINFLPSFHFHHPDPSIKKFTWSEYFRDLKIPEIIKIILDEQIICLCGNCHQLVEALHFPNIANEIFTNEFSVQIKLLYQQLYSNITNFKIDEDKISIYDPIDGIEQDSDYYKERYFGINRNR